MTDEREDAANFGDSPGEDTLTKPGQNRNLETILRIPVVVQVVLGSAVMPVSNLLKLGRGRGHSARPQGWRAGRCRCQWPGYRPRRNRRGRGRQFALRRLADGDRRPDRVCRLTMAASAPQTAGANPRFLRGPERVAALLLAMGKPLAGRMLKHFDVDELKQITRSVAELGVVPAPTLELLVEDFAGHFANGVDLLGSPSEVEQMLDGVLAPDQIADVMSDVTGSSNEAMWDRLSSVPESVFERLSRQGTPADCRAAFSPR